MAGEAQGTSGGDASQIDYAGLVEAALLEVARRVLAQVAAEGLPGEHFFYLTFDTRAEGVVLAPQRRMAYPDEMTIVLQHQFQDLAVDGEGFSVTLRFAGAPERLFVPWRALRGFVDPSVRFGLRFQAGVVKTEPSAPAPGELEPAVAERTTTAADAAVPATGKVVDFGAFRRKDE